VTLSLFAFGRTSGSFSLPWAFAGRPVTLHCYRAAAADARAPLVLVQHGMLRNGDDYRNFWVAAAERYGLQIIAPTFSNEHWPGVESYNNGGVWTQDGHLAPAAQWAYQAIPELIGQLRREGALQEQPVYLFGHSAGGQFVHRLASLLGVRGLAGIVAANPGWYTLADDSLGFPEGLGGVGLAPDALARLLATPLVILAGEQDIDTADPNLPAEPAALRQGPHRYSRALHYTEYALQQAARLGVPLAWQLHSVPGIGHDGEAMSAICAHWWFEGRMPSADGLARLAGRIVS